MLDWIKVLLAVVGDDSIGGAEDQMSSHPTPPIGAEPDFSVPPSRYCNQRFQDVFQEYDFDAREMNLHLQNSASERHALIFIHGFNGKGYSTWGRFPELLFDSPEVRKYDIGIFQYNTGYFAAAARSVHIPATIRRLRAVIQELANQYATITFMCHSLGGILAETAVAQYLTHHAIDGGGPNVKIAAMFLFGSPRAGTWMAPPILARLFREFKYLARFSDNLTDTDRFFANYIETELVAISGRKRYLIPRYVCMGDGDNVAEEFSVTYGVSDGRIYYPGLDHGEIVKPDSIDSPLIVWFRESIQEISDLRRQSLREGEFRAEHSDAMSPTNVHYVTELWTGSFGYRGKVLYDKLREEYAKVKTIAGHSIVIHDRDEVPNSNIHIDMLLSLHDASVVVDNSEIAMPSVFEARNRKLAADRMSVGIATVGERAEDAKDAIENWLAPNRPLRQFYVEPANEEGDLRFLLRDWLKSMVRSQPISQFERWEFDSRETGIKDARSPWRKL